MRLQNVFPFTQLLINAPCTRNVVFMISGKLHAKATATQHRGVVRRPTTTQGKAGARSHHLEGRRHWLLPPWGGAEDDKHGLEEAEVVMLLLQAACGLGEPTLGQPRMLQGPAPPWLCASVTRPWEVLWELPALMPLHSLLLLAQRCA